MKANEINDRYKLKELAAFLDVSWSDPKVERLNHTVSDGSVLSMLKWGEGDPEYVFLHGGGQNAHTWDAIALLLDAPMLAIDLPGHGYSDWRDDKEYWPKTNASRVAEVLDALGVRPQAIVGMSLGGLTTIRLSSIRPDLSPLTVVIDVTPSQNKRNSRMKENERGTTALIRGPRIFESLDEIITATQVHAPYRAELLIERGVVNNTRQLPNGTWSWQYDELHQEGEDPVDFEELWDDVKNIDRPVLLVIGGDSSFVGPDDREIFSQHCRNLEVRVVEGAGHSVQSDQPKVLAALLNNFFSQK